MDNESGCQLYQRYKLVNGFDGASEMQWMLCLPPGAAAAMGAPWGMENAIPPAGIWMLSFFLRISVRSLTSNKLSCVICSASAKTLGFVIVRSSSSSAPVLKCLPTLEDARIFSKTGTLLSVACASVVGSREAASEAFQSR